MSTTGRQAKIITFYSHKAGAGRTMALANIAWIMANQGKSVLTIDWDLDEPGLHLYYSKYLPNRDLSTSDGILDMFSSFAATATSQERHAEHLRGLHPLHTDFKRYDVDVHFQFPNGGHLYYLGPGRRDGRYRHRLRDFDWDRFQNTPDGVEFLAALRARMRESEYDYILIDSRTGPAEDAGICTLALPDTVVIGLSLNRPSVDGALAMAKAVKSHTARPIELHVVPLRVDTTTDPTRVERALADARAVLDPYLGITGEEALDAYWNGVLIPYQPRFSFGEELAVMIENPRQPHTLLHACVKAAHRITDGAVDSFDPAPKELREEYASWTGHADRDLTPLTVTVLHAPDDQLWAEWLGEQLTAAGITVRPAHAEPAPAPDGFTDAANTDNGGIDLGPESDHVVALLSRRLEGTAAGLTIAGLSVGADVGGARPRGTVGLRVNTARLAPHFDWPDAVNLSGLDERAAHRAVLSQFPLKTGTAPFSPADRTRFPGRTPELLSLPMRNAHFVGRSRQLAALRQGFVFSTADHTAPHVLWGMKGAGKRQVALEYAHRYASQYDLVWWIPASSADGIRAALRELAQALNDARGGARSGDDLSALLTDLRTGRYCSRWLLVFDGAENSEAIDEFIPSTGPGHVLITSLEPVWPAQYRTRQVDSFTLEESLRLLRNGLPGAETAALERLARRLGNHPLMLNAAVAELSSYPSRTDDYIALIDRRESDAPDDVVLPQYRTLGTVYRGIYDGLRRSQPAAARLLELCSFLSSDGVGLQVIESAGMIERLIPHDGNLRDALRLRTVVNQLSLAKLAVVDQKTQRLKVHRILQDLVQGWMTAGERAGTRAEVLAVLAAMVPSDLRRHEPQYQSVFAELDRHMEPSGALESSDPQVHRWLVSQVYHRRTSGLWTEAHTLGERILDRWRADGAMGEADTMVLRLESEVAAAYRALGRYQCALKLSQHSVQIQRDRAAGDVYTLLAARGYAADLRATGRFTQAFDEDSRTHAGLVAAIGKEHNATLDASINLALSKFYMETVQAAVGLDRDTYAIRRRQYGDGDFRPWISYANLGTYFRETGELNDSERYLTRSCERFLTLTGKDSHRYLNALASLGMTMVRKGDTDEGLKRLQDARAGFSRQWGERHPSTMSCDLSVAIGLHASGRSEDALQGMPDLHERYVEVFGTGHPFTSICLNNMAVYLLASEDPEAALSQARKAVYQLEKVFGPTHRYTLVARLNQSNCQYVLGRDTSTEDIGIHEDCQEQAAWGERHPVTLIALANRLATGSGDQSGLRADLKRFVADRFPDGHPLAIALPAEPYQRVGADLEVQDV
ncbi:NTPase [Streptomyces lucensis JCM 4490]|uniref:NTPase n=1 Tax=Streptomyces lucensis JCM 4490 TaxID=1306176 RepID=A0A918J2X2_9ACTN|nr:FxSxx-COOH system tetratricopeptide repeat protein [Streptomyces lucensis]GGW44035.1 NTPase [Streptomyces lucensis JCM 4490]